MKSIFKPFFFLLFSSVIFYSCHKNCIGDEYKFRVRLEVLTTYNDTIRLEYKTSNSSKPEVLSQLILAAPEAQFIEFCMSNEPIDLSVVFGSEPKIFEFKILSFLLENQKNQMFIQNEEMVFNYFLGTKNLPFNKQTSTYYFNKIDKYDSPPSLKAREPLKSRLRKKLKP